MNIDLSILGLIFFFISIVFIVEGIIYTIFPNYMKKMLSLVLSLDIEKIRFIGLLFCSIGFIMLYYIL